jgi:predicted dithiol-disulfide oxidoreductase (DUF899 family)
VTLLAISRAPLPKIEAFKKRMGWRFPWVSSHESDFNFDYHVSATKEEIAKGEMYYNYRAFKSRGEEQPGISVFYKDESVDDTIYHTYSSYARGGDLLIGTYNYLVVLRKLKEEVGPSVRLKSGPFFRQRFRTGCQRTAPGRPDLPLLPT